MTGPVPLSIPLRMPAKDPTASLDYALDFTNELADPDVYPATIASLTWAIDPVAADPTPLVISAHAETPGNTASTVRLAAGSRFTDYLVRCTRVWSDGESDVVSFALLVDYT